MPYVRPESISQPGGDHTFWKDQLNRLNGQTTRGADTFFSDSVKNSRERQVRVSAPTESELKQRHGRFEPIRSETYRERLHLPFHVVGHHGNAPMGVYLLGVLSTR